MKIPLTQQEKKVLGFILLLAALGLAVLAAEHRLGAASPGKAQAPSNDIPGRDP